ncbi:hypothetical protein QBE52_00810 [Clostridiaceae bacterium 35-E11]
MKKAVRCVVRLFIGLFLYAVGIVMTINANLGLAPWDVFHQGLSNIFHITMGQASIGAGIVLVALDSMFGEKLGWGTLGNMVFIGLFMDFLMLNHLIPIFEGFLPSLIMMLLGMFIIGVASYFYIGAGLGSGPRDGLMIALTKKTNKSVGFIRNCIEVAVLIIGYMLGGFVGIGTLITALTVGYFIQFAFKIFKFDVSQVEHKFIDEDIKFVQQVFFKPKIRKKDNTSE